MNPPNAVYQFQDFPVPDSHRKHTDICCTIISTLLFLTIFILACIFYNPTIISRWRYVSDSAGRTCGQDHIDFPYLYFASINDPSKRLCLSECPKIGDQDVHSYESNCPNCILNNNHVDIYDTEMEETMMGKFCFPTDRKIKDNLIEKGGINDRYRVLQAYKAIGISLGFSLLLGTIYTALVQAFPKTMITVSIISGAISTIVLGIVLMVFKSEAYPSLMTFRYVLGCLSIVFGSMLIGMLIVYRWELKIVGVFLMEAGNYLRMNRIKFVIIPIFLVLTYAVLILGVFQSIAFFSKGNAYFTEFSPYFQVKSSFKTGILHIINIFSILWGLNFVRQASVFIGSGYIIGWYAGKPINPTKALFKHWGSVVACAFMVGFFGVIDMIYLFFSPKQSSVNSCAQITKTILSPLQNLSRFIRQQALAYINLTGLPYCNSSTYCEFLTNRSQLSQRQGNKPIIRYYRYGAYFLLVSLTLVFLVIFQNSTIGVVPFLSVLVSGVLSLYVVSGFIDIHADMAASLFLAYSLENEISRGQELKTERYREINGKLFELQNEEARRREIGENGMR